MTDNMELKDFISKAIIDICRGIKEAQRTIYDEVQNVPIAPAFMDGKSKLKEGEQKISFDIWVSISNNTKMDKTGEAKIINVIGGSINKETSASNAIANRIQFSVPFYPQALEKYDKK